TRRPRVAPGPSRQRAAGREPAVVRFQWSTGQCHDRQRSPRSSRSHRHAGGEPGGAGPFRLHRLPPARGAGRHLALGSHDRGHCDCRPAGGIAMTPVAGLYNYLVVGAVLFVLGLIGFLARRNLIIMFLSAEMMLQGVAINLVAFARYRGNLQGQAFVLFMLTVAACEAGIALALILTLCRGKRSLDVSLWQELREPGQEPTMDEEPLPPPEPLPELPKLTPAGAEPRPESVTK